MSIVLIGMKHCGKSTVGRVLARRHGGRFADTDTLIEEAFARQAGRSLTVRDIFRQEGEARFVERERSVVRDLAAERVGASDELVLAVGGPTPLRPDLQPILRELGTVVYLRLDEAELLRRVMAGGVPAFLDGQADPEDAFISLCRQRHPVYESVADLAVDLDGLDPAASADRVLQALSTEVE